MYSWSSLLFIICNQYIYFIGILNHMPIVLKEKSIIIFGHNFEITPTVTCTWALLRPQGIVAFASSHTQLGETIFEVAFLNSMYLEIHQKLILWFLHYHIFHTELQIFVPKYVLWTGLGPEAACLFRQRSRWRQNS